MNAASSPLSVQNFPGALHPLQHTLQISVECRGTAVHSGATVRMGLHPAPIGHGIKFRRSDIDGDAALIDANWQNVIGTNHCTELGNANGVRVATVEHVLAAIAGFGIDNILITVDGPELPIMDGSAAPFLFLLECAGIIEQAAPRRALRILREVTVADQGKIAVLSPSSGDSGLSIDFEIEFATPVIGHQRCAYRTGFSNFKFEISRARSFGFLADVADMRAAGLARGASLDCAVVIAEDRVLNEGGLRYPDEFVRHKLLDCIGDLALAGGPIIGHYFGLRAGHAMTNRVLRAVFADPSHYTWITARDAEMMPLPNSISKADYSEIVAAVA